MRILIETIPHEKQRICRKCGEKKDVSEFYTTSAYKDGLDTQCKKCKGDYDKNRVMTWGREKRLKNQNNYYQRLRQLIIQEYGGSCECCGESTPEFLEIDHINGGGIQHRKKVGSKIYSVIKKEKFPKDKYRLLCANCNHSLGTKGYCSHQILKNKQHVA